MSVFLSHSNTSFLLVCYNLYVYYIYIKRGVKRNIDTFPARSPDGGRIRETLPFDPRNSSFFKDKTSIIWYTVSVNFKTAGSARRRLTGGRTLKRSVNVPKKLFSFLQNEYIYSILTRFLTIAIGIVQSVLVARYLGTELKGINAYVGSITSVGSIIITFGMHQAYPYFRKKYGKEKIYRDYVSLIMLLYSCYLAIGIALAFTLPVSLEIKAVFILIPLLGYSNIVSYVTLIERPNLRNTWWTAISIFDIIYVALLWIFIKRSVFWAISILLFQDLCKCVIYTVLLKVKPRFHKGLFPLLIDLAKFGFFPMLALLMTTLNYRIDVLMLRQYNIITDSMIGIYSLGLSLSDKIVLIPDTLKGVLVSKLAKGADDYEVAKVSRLGFWASVFLCILIFIFGQWAINLLYGAEFSGAYPVVLITSFGALAISYFKLIAQYNIIHKKQILNVAMLSVAIVVDVVLNLAFIPVWGIEGAALATSIGNLVCGVVFIAYFCRRAHISAADMILIRRSDLAMLKSIFKKKKKKAAASGSGEPGQEKTPEAEKEESPAAETPEPEEGSGRE